MVAQRSARLRGYLEEVEFALEMGDGPFLRETRERLAALALDETETTEVARLDGFVIDQIATLDEVQSFLLDDDDTQPLEHWWWHLGKLRARTYPAHCLPEHLRAGSALISRMILRSLQAATL